MTPSLVPMYTRTYSRTGSGFTAVTLAARFHQIFEPALSRGYAGRETGILMALVCVLVIFMLPPCRIVFPSGLLHSSLFRIAAHMNCVASGRLRPESARLLRKQEP